MELKTVSGKEWVKAHPERFFRTGSPTGLELAYHILCDALHLTHKCTIARHGEWWIVSSANDWVAHESLAVRQLFSRVVPAPEQGVNSMRAEVILSAYAQDVATFDGEQWLVVEGAIPPAVRDLVAMRNRDDRGEARKSQEAHWNRSIQSHAEDSSGGGREALSSPTIWEVYSDAEATQSP